MNVTVITLTADDSILEIYTGPDSNAGIVFDAGVHTKYTNVPEATFTDVPVIGGTYDGATFTAGTKPDYLIFKDGATELADGELISFAHDIGGGKTITIQKKDGEDDSDKTGTETILIDPAVSIIVIDSLEEDLVAGVASFTIGPQAANNRGCVEIKITDQAGVLVGRSMRVRMT